MKWVAARTGSLLTLLIVMALLLAPAFALPLPVWASIPAATRLALLLLGAALALETLQSQPLARRLALAAAMLGAISIGTWLVSAALGPLPAAKLLALR